MADGSDGTDVSPESEATAAAVKGGEIWGTLEELLLACAVTRHGTGSWDSVAAEVQTRSPVAARPGLTPHSCRLRFRHLHRRFSTVGSSGEEADADADADAEEDPDASAAEGWVDELRRLRVAELRRDVERCDLSIGSLQSKVKRLREERERSVSGEAKPDEASVNDRLSSEEPGRSCRESNSTDLKPPRHPGHQGGGGGAAKEEEVAKQEASVESAAASKESSDVRSSASLCRRRRGGGSEKADEEEEEAASAARTPPARSPPLASLLDAVSAKLGSVLQRLREHDSEEPGAPIPPPPPTRRRGQEKSGWHTMPATSAPGELAGCQHPRAQQLGRGGDVSGEGGVAAGDGIRDGVFMGLPVLQEKAAIAVVGRCGQRGGRACRQRLRGGWAGRWMKTSYRRSSPSAAMGAPATGAMWAGIKMDRSLEW